MKLHLLSISVLQAINRKWLGFIHIRATNRYFFNAFPIFNGISCRSYNLGMTGLVTLGRFNFFILKFSYGVCKPPP